MFDHHCQWPDASGDLYASSGDVSQRLSVHHLYHGGDRANTCRHLFSNFTRCGQLVHHHLVYHQQHRGDACGFMHSGQRIIWQ